MAEFKRLFDLERFSDRITDMATTSNYGWTTPDDTDLVKNGALAIRTLGSAIDTTVYNNLGLIHIETQNPSAVSGVSFTSKFSAVYEHYLLVWSLIASTTNNIVIRVRSGSSDDSNTNYDRQRISAAAGVVSSAQSLNETNFTIAGGLSSSVYNSGYVNIYNPFLSIDTCFVAHAQVGANINDNYGYHDVLSSFDGVSVLTSTGTMTGTISLFGYRK